MAALTETAKEPFLFALDKGVPSLIGGLSHFPSHFLDSTNCAELTRTDVNLKPLVS